MIKRIALLVCVLITPMSFCDAIAAGQLQDVTKAHEKIMSEIDSINAAELIALTKKEHGLVFIDVRLPEDLGAHGGTLDYPRIFNIDRGWLEYRAPERVPDKDTPIIVFCGDNQRSPFAVKTLLQMGYTNVKNLQDGFISWRAAGHPIKGDNAPDSMLYHQPEEVVEGVWTSIGATAPSTYFNAGHNNNLSFIVTKDGVVVVNAGGSYLLAQALHDEIKKVTDLAVKYVILENGQGHAMLGSSYWQAQGAEIVVHKDAAAAIDEYGENSLDSARTVLRDKAMHTKLAQPDIVFDDKYIIKLGGQTIEAINLGPAHSPGDIVVWLPEKELVISGDMAFHQRLLPVMEHTDTDAWIDSWEAFVGLQAKYIIPGHGGPTDYAEVTRYTRDYLVFMRQKISQILDDGGELQDAYTVDQSDYSHLDTYFELSRQNAGRIYREMEFE
ncbi:MAG: MBL fold metallo-hydrolase [Arenicella sp.]